MKIAFASCADPLADPVQSVWDRIREKGPDVLLLVGDIMYMDYGILGDHRLGWPRKASLQEFADAIYERYRKQAEIASFQRLLASGVRLGMTWDDHDFAWNNSRGAGTSPKYAVPRDKRLVSRGLFLQFKEAIAQPAAAYPPMPPIDNLLSAEDDGIQSSFDVDAIRFVMLDGRSFREDPNDIPDAELHGRTQRTWFAEKLRTWNGVKIVCSGSVLTHSRESWDQYMDLAWLLQQAPKRTVVLSGDIHRNVPPTLHANGLVEITSSGAARPGIGGASGNFAVIDTADELSVSMYSNSHPEGIRAPITF